MRRWSDFQWLIDLIDLIDLFMCHCLHMDCR